MSQKDVWLISMLKKSVTGCSSGLGKALAKHAYEMGCPVVATARRPETLSYLPDGDKNVLKLGLDVTVADQVDQVIKTAVDRFGCLDVVVNNAAYGLTGDTEVIPDADARAQLETNFWGPVNVTKAVLPVMREVNPHGKGGLVMQISSVGGRVCFPGGAFYHASKFALEGFTDTVAKEMHPDWNIKFTIIEPGVLEGGLSPYQPLDADGKAVGAVLTNFVQNMTLPPRHPAYEDPACGYNKIGAYMASMANTVQWSDPTVCARVLHELASNRNETKPPLRLALGADAWAAVKAELESITRENEAWKSVAESTSHAENAKARDFLLDHRQ
ncbi:putative oxidoreductase [Cladophialophora carrionii]|uniref:Putative oxidoreductase n=1 Tax=Cladophialophora carrionii TaxID=86049 RepID=A0A1C1CB60_9EURO|nr:putative oxidoreductase [Cladophialophora carrionii]